MCSPREDRRNVEARIELVSEGGTIRGFVGQTIFEVLRSNGIPIEGSCGGQGTCGECRVRFVDRPPDATAADLACLDPAQIAAGWRLACSHTLQGALRIEVQATTGDLRHKEQHDTTVSVENLDVAITARTVSVVVASRDAPRARSERVQQALGEEFRMSLSTLRRLASLPGGVAGISAIESEGDILDVRTEAVPRIHGIAIDVGTTTLAVYLFDLATGRQLGAAATRNPQQRFGADVIARIAHVRRMKAEGLAELHASVMAGLNGLIERLAVDASISAESIYGATIVGNPTMLHLLLAVDPTGIDVSPYVPTFTHRLRCYAEDIGLAVAPRAVIDTLPGISAYIGADVVAGILATRLAEREDATLFLDVGTNGEIVLTMGGRLIACSTAAGPAFEGASIVQGMAALDGAIEHVCLRDGRIESEVIGDVSPVGLCGTGLVSAVAELRAAGIIDPSGRFNTEESRFPDRFEGEGKEKRFRLTDGVNPVYLYQGDVREFQLAKAAIRAGIEILMQHVELGAQDIDCVLIGGAFSGRVAVEHLVETGLLPGMDPSQIDIVGNTAGRGAKQVLLNRQLMNEAVRLARSVEYIELSGDSRFADLYVEQISFPDGE